MKQLSPRRTRLKAALDDLYDQYLADFQRNPADFFERRKDPILFPHRYDNFADVEAAAFLAATFAYGNVTSLCSFVGRLLDMLGPAPGSFLQQGPDAIGEIEHHRPYYRLQKSREILDLLRMLSVVYSKHGSLYVVFMESYDNNSTWQMNVARFTDRLRELGGADLKFLVPSPASGSTCKRLNLFLRWMVRRDGIDFGLWRDVPPASLVVPLDTHIARVALKLRWIRTPSLTWQKAERITGVLRSFDPADPTRYDFSLCHESMQRSPALQELVKATTKAPSGGRNRR